jgi:hypothetical protein
MANQVTGIPIEYMFGAIVGLVGVVYSGIAYELRRLRDGAYRRDLLLVKICEKLSINLDLGK